MAVDDANKSSVWLTDGYPVGRSDSAPACHRFERRTSHAGARSREGFVGNAVFGSPVRESSSVVSTSKGAPCVEDAEHGIPTLDKDRWSANHTDGKVKADELLCSSFAAPL